MTTRELECTCVPPAAAPQPRPRPSGTARRRSRQRRSWALIVAGAIVASALVAGLGPGVLVKPEGASAFVDFFTAALRPRLDREFLALIATATLTTQSYAVLGTVVSLVIGLVGGVLAAQTWWSSHARSGSRNGLAGWVLVRGVLVIPRGIHEVVWALFFLVIFGLDPIVAVLAIGIPFGAITAKVFSEILDGTGRRPYQALVAAGAPRGSAILYGLLPPALGDLLSYSFYRFECAIRSAAILGLIGAGGLGFQLMLSFQALRYDEIWTSLYALIILSIAADTWSHTVRTRRSTTGRRADRVRTGSWLAAAALITFSVWWIGLNPSGLFSAQAWHSAGQFFAEAWPPAWGYGGLGALIGLSAETLAMSVLATAIAYVGGALLAFPAAKLPIQHRTGRRSALPRTATRLVTKLLLVVLRAIPPPVWALLFLFILYPGLLPAALALGVYTAGVLGRLMAEAAENLDTGPLRALRSHGATGPQILCYGVIPAATPRFVAYGLYRWEVTIRETVVVGVVGAGGLGVALQHQLSGFQYAGALTTIIAIMALTLIVDLTSAAMRRALR